MITLLDVNVLIALLDPQHLHYDPAHQFWADALSWSAKTLIRGDQLLAHSQITDVELLALAVHHQWVLVSFDARINTRVVQGGQQALQLIPSLP